MTQIIDLVASENGVYQISHSQKQVSSSETGSTHDDADDEKYIDDEKEKNLDKSSHL